MSLNSSNVRVAVTGAVYVGPTSADAPTDADTPPAGFGDLGYVHEDGVTETRERSTEQLRAWQNADVLREVVTEASMTYTFRLVETKAETVELFYGTSVNPADGSVAIIPARTGGRKSFVIDVIDGDDFIRAYIPSGEVTEVGDQVYSNGEPVGYEVTITAYPSAAIQTDEGANGSVKKFYSSLVSSS
ncbi:hypothetical protein [Mycolicibacterium sp.]|uniref:phage tail tube protein n=1 Tax=Mycolicibacterium sp. TaxID=2320850 RepID=UPI00355E84F6